MEVSDIVTALGLEPHPEGGWFRETWRSPLTVASNRGLRSAGTSILYLMAPGTVSRLHCLVFDEVWHWHGGGALLVHRLGLGGAVSMVLDVETPQLVIPGGTWFGAEVTEGASHVLVGCTMAPGFDEADWELGDREELLAGYPESAALIERLTA